MKRINLEPETSKSLMAKPTRIPGFAGRLFLLLATVLVLGNLTQCKSIASFFSGEEIQSGIVVTFKNGEVTIERQGSSFQPTQGSILVAGDIIQTGSGSLDLQTPKGDIIRIKSYSKFIINEIIDGDKSSTKGQIQWGELVVKTKKLKSQDEFQILTPTTVAGVRGTTFSIELEKGKVPKIRVFEGAVAVSMRMEENGVEALSEVQDESMQKLIENLKDKEIILEASEESEINPTVHEIFHLINFKQKGSLAKESGETTGSPLNLAALSGSPDSGLEKQKFQITPQKSAELDTMVETDPSLVAAALEAQKTNSVAGVDSNAPSAVSSDLTEKIVADHGKKLESAVANIEKSANSKQLDSEEEIQNYYSILEVVNLSSGEKMSGAIITQIGDTILLHSTKGTTRLNLSDIEYVEYKSFEIKTKSKK
jgi:hypothetical protein